MKTKKIVLIGGPGSGKTSVINALEDHGYPCLHEISRQVILEAQKDGISQLFLEKPVLFSELLLEGRIKQYQEAEEKDHELVFIDRGIPDVVAYMDYFGNKYPPFFKEVCKKYTYDLIFVFPPWKDIYVSDNERYETFEQAESIHSHLMDSYKDSGYHPIEVPFRSVQERRDFILEHLP